MPSKDEIRRAVWKLLVERKVARPPFPVEGRIPNFAGAEKAAELLSALNEYRGACVVFCNPDSPQRPIREMALRDGKVVVMATPRLREGFLILDPRRIPRASTSFASTIRGAFTLGEKVGIDGLPEIDLKVTGSVAVTRKGERLGKGHGYSEVEYGILREVGVIKEETPVVTTVHELQIVDEVPQDPFDVSVDYVVTPKRVIRAEGPKRRPPGILWQFVTEEMLKSMPPLAELRSRARF